MGRRLAVSSKEWVGSTGRGRGGGASPVDEPAVMGDGGAGKNDDESEKSFEDGVA